MYKVTVDVNQSIYDGSVTGYQKKLEVSIFNRTKKVSRLIVPIEKQDQPGLFQHLILQKNEEILKSNKSQMELKLKEVSLR